MTLEEMLGSLIANHREKIVERAIDKLSLRLAKLCMPDAETQFRERMILKIEELVESQTDSLLSATFVDTDNYGNPRYGSKPKTIVELMLEECVKWMEEKVDKDGHAGSGWGTTKDRTRAKWLASQAAQEMVQKELEPAIKLAKEELKRQFDGKLAQAFQEAVKNCLKP